LVFRKERETSALASLFWLDRKTRVANGKSKSKSSVAGREIARFIERAVRDRERFDLEITLLGVI